MAKGNGKNGQGRRLNTDGSVDRRTKTAKVTGGEDDSRSKEISSLMEEKSDVVAKALDESSGKKVSKKAPKKPKKATKKSTGKIKGVKKTVPAMKKEKSSKSAVIPKVEDVLVSEEMPEAKEVSEMVDVPDAEEVPLMQEIPEVKEVPELEEVPEMEDVPEVEEVQDVTEIPEPSPIPDFESIPDAEEIPEAEEIPKAAPFPEAEDLPLEVELPEPLEPIEPEEIPPEVPESMPVNVPDEVEKNDIRVDDESVLREESAREGDSSVAQNFSPTYIYQNDEKPEPVIQTYGNMDMDERVEPVKAVEEESQDEPMEDSFGQPDVVEAQVLESEQLRESDEKMREEEEITEMREIRKDVKEILKGADIVEAEDQEENVEKGDSLFSILGRIMHTVGPAFASVFNMKIIFSCLGLLLVLGVGYLGYTQNWLVWMMDLFKEKEKPAVVGISDERVMSENGVLTALIAGNNIGSVRDLVPAQIIVAEMYGLMREPSLSGETGISAATYFGELMDEKGFVNQFVVYVQFIENMRNMYRADVYALLDMSTRRSDDLEEYLAELKRYRVEGNKNLILIGVFADDLVKSYNSLTPDKTKLESDFFGALEELEAEKSDTILKSFIDVSQKQVALKARISAITKLKTYYEYALERLDLRIEGIEKNKQALIEGIRVVEVPGSGIDLIIKP